MNNVNTNQQPGLPALRRQIKREVKQYMKCEVLCLRVFAHCGRNIVAVDYVDFLPQSEVERHIRSICPPEWEVITNRLWSDETAKSLLFQMLSEETDRENHLFRSVNPVLTMCLASRFRDFSCVNQVY